MTTAKIGSNVRYVEVGERFIGEVPVECVIFHKTDGTVATVRLLPEQMEDLRVRLSARLTEIRRRSL